MNEFKFSCPNCQQNIEATPEYSGAQINCPVCQTLIVVPQAPSGPVPVPQGTKLSKAPSSVNRMVTAAPFIAQGAPVRRKKKKGPALIVGLIVAAGAVSAGINYGPSLYAKYFQHEEAAAAEQAPTNAPPPPPPPELTTAEILQKVAETYQGLDSFAIKGQAVGAIDVSQINRMAQGLQNSRATVALQLGRPDNYRMEWERTINGTAVKGVAWCSGKGDFAALGPNPPGKVKSREAALNAAGISTPLCALIAELFFNETNNLATQADAFARTNGAALSGQKCYILNGELQAHNIVLWINRSTFLIPQIEYDFGGKLDEAALKKLPAADRDQMMRISKLKGNVVETYETVETNPKLTAASFERPYTPSPAATATAAPAAGRQRGGQRPTVGAGSATQLTRRVRPAPQ